MDPSAPSPTADQQDAAWLAEVAAGNRDSFARLYRRHHGKLRRFLSRMTWRRDLIDDVLNDSWWVVWRSAARFRGDSKVATWVTGIAYRCMLKALREHDEPLAAGEIDDDTPAEADGAHSAQQHELRDWLAEGLRRLSPEQRLTLELLYYMGESCEGIAAIMDCAVGTVKARLFHARMRLRNLLPEIGEPHSSGGPGQRRSDGS